MDKKTTEKAFMPKDECSICGSDYDEECGGIQGSFGIMVDDLVSLICLPGYC